MSLNYLTDTHAHLRGEGIHDLLARAQAAGVGRLIHIATSIPEMELGFTLQQEYPWVDVAVATHPHDAEQGVDEQRIRTEGHRLIAIGETGLDYHYEHAPKATQQQLLIRHFALAMELRLPIIIHCREAFQDFFSLWADTYQGPGVVHCFTGTQEEAAVILERGWYLSFSGIVTFKKSLQLQDIVRTMPMDRLLIETDAPYLAPEPFRGKPNESAYVATVARYVAQLRNIPYEELVTQTTHNAHTLFPRKTVL